MKMKGEVRCGESAFCCDNANLNSNGGGLEKRTDVPLSVRTWDCPECGASHDRDHNAAKNILDWALNGVPERATDPEVRIRTDPAGRGRLRNAKRWWTPVERFGRPQESRSILDRPRLGLACEISQASRGGEDLRRTSLEPIFK